MRNLGELFRTMAAIAVLLMLPAVALADIAGTSHDLSSAGWATSSAGTQEICVVCHTPHNADTTILDAPLWNHEITTESAYTVYSSGTLNAAVGQPAGISKLCLSCHDGTVAIDAFGGKAGGTWILTSTSTGYVGTDLSDDHPISFVYNDTLATDDGGLYEPSTATATGVGGGSTIEVEMLFGAGGTGTKTLECASCHDAHGVFGVNKFLVKSNLNSDLCLTCHDK